MAEAGPCPVFGLLDQAALDRVAVHIAKFLDPLLFVMNEKVVVARLPERPLRAPRRD